MTNMGITVYGCEQDEAVLFRKLAPHFGVTPTITDAGVSEANIELAAGNRCISVGHKAQITHSVLLALSQAGAFVINTGRGSLIDTEALIAALASGKLSGAVLDVLEGEEGIFYADYTKRPVENERLLKLQKLPNVLITPHTAYYTDHALRDTVENSITNCLKFERREHE